VAIIVAAVVLLSVLAGIGFVVYALMTMDRDGDSIWDPPIVNNNFDNEWEPLYTFLDEADAFSYDNGGLYWEVNLAISQEYVPEGWTGLYLADDWDVDGEHMSTRFLFYAIPPDWSEGCVAYCTDESYNISSVVLYDRQEFDSLNAMESSGVKWDEESKIPGQGRCDLDGRLHYELR
jgi:hypothetical protein